MAKFDIGETLICSCEVKNSSGVYYDPSTSMKITITDNFNAKKVDAVAMTKDSTGKYHYDCQTSGYDDGIYKVKYIATDGSRISIEKQDFSLE